MNAVDDAQVRVLQRVRYSAPCDGGIRTRCKRRGTWLDVAATETAREADPCAPAVHLCKVHALRRYPDIDQEQAFEQWGLFG